jgi:hypothetical protein
LVCQSDTENRLRRGGIVWRALVRGRHDAWRGGSRQPVGVCDVICCGGDCSLCSLCSLTFLAEARARACHWRRRHGPDKVNDEETNTWNNCTTWAVQLTRERAAGMPPRMSLASICFTPTASTAEMTGVEGAVKRREKPGRGVSGMVGGGGGGGGGGPPKYK